MALQAKRGYQPSKEQWGPHLSSYLADLTGRAQVLHQPDGERGNGSLPPHLHAGVRQFCPNRACDGHVDVSNEAPFQCRRPIARLYRGVAEEGATHTLVER